MKKAFRVACLVSIAAVLFGCGAKELDPTPTPSKPDPEKPTVDPQPPTPEPGTIRPDEWPEGDYTTAEGSIFLPESFVETISSNNPDEQYFETTSGDLPGVGQILVYNKPSAFFPEGILCRVSRVEAPYVYYETVLLEEAFPKMSIDTTGLDLAAHLAYVLDGEGNVVDYSNTKAISSTSFEISVPSTTWELYTSGVNYQGLEANLKVTFQPSLRVKLGLRFQAIIDEGEVLAMNILVDPSIHIGGSVTALGELAASKSFPLYTFYFQPIPMGPLVFVPKITLEGYLKVDGSVGVEASVSYDKGFSIGAAYETGDWRPIIRGVETEGSGSNPATFSSKIEGGVSVGVRPKLEFRLYDILGAAIGADVNLRAGISHKMDLNQPDAFNTPLGDVSFNTSLNIKGTMELNAKVADKVLYEGLNFASPEMNFTLYEAWLMPEICTSTMEIEPNPTGATISGMLKRNVIKKGNLYAHVFDPADWEYVEKPEGGYGIRYKNERYVSVDWTEPKSAKDSTKFKVDLGTYQAGTTYQVDMVMSIPGSDKYMLRGDSTLFFRTFNEKQAKVVADVVSKVAHAMNWSDTPWYDVSPYDVLYMADKGINVSTSYEDGHLMFITLTPDPSWRYPNSIHVPESVGSSLEDGQYWSLHAQQDYPEEAIANITSIIVEDPKYGGGIPGGKGLKHYEIHSPQYIGYDSAYGLINLETLDLSGSGVMGVNIGHSYDIDNNPFKLKSIKLDNCPNLEDVSVIWPYHHELPSISVAGSRALETIELSECLLSEGSVINGIDGLDLLTVRACSGVFNVPSGVEHAYITAVYPDLSVTATSCSSLKSLLLSSAWDWDTGTLSEFADVTLNGLNLEQEMLEIHAKNISITSVNVKEMNLYASSSVEVLASPGMETLSIHTPDSFPYGALGSFSGLTGLKTINMDCYGAATTGIVPKVIDEVRNRGGNVIYPQRYYYKFDPELGKKGRWTMSSDLGYGFYYSGEPYPRCYHYYKPDNYDEYNN